MAKGRELISLPIINLTNGKYLGEVKELLYDDQLAKIEGFIVESKSWFKGAKILPWENIYSVGEDAITVTKEKVFVDSKKSPKYKSALKNKNSIQGLKIYSEKGDDLGVIVDLEYDVENGEIIGMELSDGLVSDLFKGRKVVDFPAEYEIKEDTIFINDVLFEEKIRGEEV